MGSQGCQYAWYISQLYFQCVCSIFMLLKILVKNANLKKFDIFFQFFLIPSSLMAQWWVTHLLNWSQSLTDICKNTRETVLSLQRGPLVSSGSALGLPKARIWIPSTLKGAGFSGCWGCVWPSVETAIFMQIHKSASHMKAVVFTIYLVPWWGCWGCWFGLRRLPKYPMAKREKSVLDGSPFSLRYFKKTSSWKIHKYL